MEVMHIACAGLDVHKDTVVASIRVQSGSSVLRETRTFATLTRGLLELSDWLSSHHISALAMEATGVYWKPVWHILESGFELTLANPAHIKNVPGRKSDTHDAQWIAELLAHGLIQASFVPPESIQELRDLTRTRKQLAQEIASYTQRIQKTLEDANLKLSSVATDILGVSGRRMLEAIIQGETDPQTLAGLAVGRLVNKRDQLTEALRGRVREHHRFLLKLHLEQITALEQGLGSIESRLHEVMTPFAQALERLQTIPGVGETLAQVIVAEIGVDMDRFQDADHLVSWAGLCPRLDESAGKRRSSRIRPGNRWLKTGLVQAAWASSRCKTGYLPARFRRIRARRGAKKAVVANAAFILRAAYYVLKNNVEFKDLGEDHLERRNKDRAISRLVGQLERLGVKVALEPVAA